MNISVSPEGRPAVALIAGPTASGKSALALALAETMPSVIINADSMQVYRDLRIVTARPGEAEEAQAAHRLFGYIDGAEACSAARWATDARQAIAEAHAAGRLPILVGGTGLYIRTLLDGIAPVPEIDLAIRAEVRALPVAQAHAKLSSVDPEAAARLSPNDSTRVARALEVVRSTGHPLSYWQSRLEGGIGDEITLAPLILLPPRDWLLARCDDRFGIMMRDGQEEVHALLARDLDPALPVMRAIGVAEIASGDAEAGRIATRQYAKRQYTWFSRQPPEHWPRHTQAVYSKDIADLVIKLRINCLTS